MIDLPFGTRLRAATEERGPLCVGVDPHASLLGAWGLEDTPAGLESFALGATEALAPHVAVLKPQSAFFERHGSAGIAVMEKVIATAREAGCLVLLDVKRGDIGSTSQAYADAYLDPRSSLFVDAITVSPYLGFGSLDPMIATARANHAGVFVLGVTSNPEAPEVQMARRTDGVIVAAGVFARLAELNDGADPLGSFGAVVGATVDTNVGDTGVDYAMNGPLLVPGVGAQGGTPESVRAIFGSAVRNMLPSSSREVLAAGPDPAALVAAADRTTAGFADLLGA